MDRERLNFLRALGLRSFYHFVKIFGSYNRQGGDISPITHRQVCDFLSDYSTKRKGLAMPRGTRKTTLNDRWLPLWRYLKNPNLTVMIGAETKDIAKASVKWIKEQVEGHDFLRAVYPELRRIDNAYKNKHTWSDEELIFPRPASGSTAPTIMCIGVGGAAQGRHVDLFTLTDIIGDKAMTSQTSMLDTILWTESLQELLIEPNPKNPNGSEIIMDFTHWCTGDCYEYLQDKYPDWEWRIIPALKAEQSLITESQRGKKNIVFIQHPDQPVMETNFPDVIDEETKLPRFSTDYYKNILRDNPRVFWTQHMNMPHHQDSSANTFKYSWLRWYIIARENDDVYLECDDGTRVPLSRLHRYGSIDPGGFASSGLKNTQSRCAFVIAGQDVQTARKFLLHTWAKRIMEPSKFVTEIITAYKKWRPISILVETIGAQEIIYKQLFEASVLQNCRLPLRRTPKDATALQEEAKNRRISNLIAPFSDGQIFIKKDMVDFIAEYSSHPGLSNDLLDALSWINELYWGSLGRGHLYELNRDREQAWLDSKQRG